MAVVDPNYEYMGLRLRVVDASIMPTITTKSDAPIIMIGEKAADLIKTETDIALRIYVVNSLN